MACEHIHGQEMIRSVGTGISTGGHPGSGAIAKTGGWRGSMYLDHGR